MSRYIDADAAIQWVEENVYYTDKFKRIMEGVINKQPTVDAVQVVRCGECKHWDKWACDKDGRHECLYNGGVWMKDEFCSDGERKDGERRTE